MEAGALSSGVERAAERAERDIETLLLAASCVLDPLALLLLLCGEVDFPSVSLTSLCFSLHLLMGFLFFLSALGTSATGT